MGVGQAADEVEEAHELEAERAARAEHLDQLRCEKAARRLTRSLKKRWLSGREPEKARAMNRCTRVWRYSELEYLGLEVMPMVAAASSVVMARYTLRETASQ